MKAKLQEFESRPLPGVRRGLLEAALTLHRTSRLDPWRGPGRCAASPLLRLTVNGDIVLKLRFSVSHQAMVLVPLSHS